MVAPLADMMNPITLSDPAFWVVSIPAALLFGISKGGFGGGLGIVAVPLMSLVMSPVQAAGILLPMLLVLDAAGIRAFWGRWDWPSFRLLGFGAVLGIAAGGITFGLVSPDVIRVLIGAVALAFSAYHYYRQWRPLDLARRTGGPAVAVVAGLTSGYTSTLAHAGSPPVTMYLLPKGLPRQQFVATTVILFALINATKLIPYGLLGQLAPGNVVAAGALVPAGLLGLWLGIRLQRILSERWFYHICYGLLILVGGRLLYDGGRQLLAAG